MKRLHRFFLACGLALAFALGQHAAALHALGHAAGSLSHNESAPAPSKCADHSLFSTIGAAVGSQAAAAPCIAAATPPALAPFHASASLAARFSFHSRAPPTLS